ncbi:MAG TPA: FAD-dependent oxidoreductase, partial [Arthrobacter sp.]|nr:FAD-dependent oxidoreductase [Arthrobacter sp.]
MRRRRGTKVLSGTPYLYDRRQIRSWRENRKRREFSLRAIICGAGISGLSAAAFLARDGWQVLVVEQAGGPRPQGYMIDFFG